MSEGNGADIGAVYQLLREVARTVDGHTQILREHSQILSEHSQRFREIDKRLDDLTAGLGSLREAVAHFLGARARRPDQRIGRARAPHRAASQPVARGLDQ